MHQQDTTQRPAPPASRPCPWCGDPSDPTDPDGRCDACIRDQARETSEEPPR